jgi:hypothetical protein
VLSSGVGHEYQDQVSFELARRVAVGLPEHPEWLELARANLNRWSQLNSNSPSLLRCYAEWRDLLALPLVEIQGILLSETGEGQRLRQNSPFAGVLSAREVWDIKKRTREHATSPA